MGLELTGELLACNSENVTSRDGKFADFISTTIVVMDGGRVTEARAGRDLSGADLARLKDAVKDRPSVRLEVFPSNDRYYVVSIKGLTSEAPARPTPVPAAR